MMLKDAYMIDGNQDDLDEAIADLIGFNKFLSILFLRKINFPTLNGIIITKWSEYSLEKVEYFTKRYGFTRLLLRHDKNPEKPPYPRGGYLVEHENIEQETKRYIEQNRIVFWLEPANCLHNIYSINCLFNRDDILFEIVGPGFDASDLQRGDQSPHEVISMDIGSGRIIKRKINANNTNIYRKSVEWRYLKIASNIEKNNKIVFSKQDDTTRIYQTKKYLLEHGFDLLTRNENQYTAISDKKIRLLFSYLKQTVSDLSKLTKVDYPFVVSCGYIHSIHRLIFWDITWPERKFSSQIK